MHEYGTYLLLKSVIDIKIVENKQFQPKIHDRLLPACHYSV